MQTTAKLNAQRYGAWKRKMRVLPPAVRTGLSRAAERNAKSFREAAQRQAPVLTGELRVSIVAYPAAGFQGSVWRVRAGLNGQEGFYSRFREFGTVHQEAEPFFFVTYRAMRRSFNARSSREIRKAQREAIK